MNIQRKRTIVFAGGTAVFFSMIGFILYPLLQGISQDYQALLFSKKEVMRITRDVENMRKFEQIFFTYEDEFSNLQDVLINSDIPIPLIEFLEESAQASQLELVMIPGNPKHVIGDSWPSLNFQLTLHGEYPNFIKFVGRLEAAPYLIELNNLTVQKIKKTQGVEVKKEDEFILLVKVFTQ